MVPYESTYDVLVDMTNGSYLNALSSDPTCHLLVLGPYGELNELSFK